LYTAGPGNHHERRVAFLKEREIAQGVHKTGATCALLVPCWIEHEVVNDQLTATLEEVLEILFAMRALEGIVLFDLDHGKPAPLGIHSVVDLGEILFMS